MKGNNVLRAVAAAAWLLATGPVLAQTSGEQGFRDPATGKIWTPDNVGTDTKPVAPADRAFDPNGQAVVMGTSTEHDVTTSSIGNVPIDAGPSVPLVDIGDLRLSEKPGEYWSLEVHLSNHSDITRTPAVECDFHNAGQTVFRVMADLQPVPAGDRVGFSLRGPRSEIFVDSARCRIERP